MSWAPPPPWFDETCPNCDLPEILCDYHITVMEEIRAMDAKIFRIMLWFLGAAALLVLIILGVSA